jgi:cell division protein FtsI (penicillin-binding protein 3)
VFKEIADKVYATCLDLDLEWSDVAGSHPSLVASNADDAKLIMARLGLPTSDWDESSNYISVQKNGTSTTIKASPYLSKTTPNVTGMNARDAVYLLESLGYKVMLNGRGVVREQSIDAGSAIVAGQHIWLRLS